MLEQREQIGQKSLTEGMVTSCLQFPRRAKDISKRQKDEAEKVDDKYPVVIVLAALMFVFAVAVNDDVSTQSILGYTNHDGFTLKAHSSML